MKKILFPLVLIYSFFFFTSCEEKIIVGINDHNNFDNIGVVEAFLLDNKSGQSENVIELRKDVYTATLNVNLTKSANKGVDFKVYYDADYVNEYNTKHGTDYKLFPKELITFDGKTEVNVLMAPDEKKSLSINLEVISKSELLFEDEVYLLPLNISTMDDEVSISPKSRCTYLVRKYNKESDCDKGEGEVKNFLYLEVNDVNPLNVLEFVREDGKLFFDYVVLFAANINWDAENGRVYVRNNPNVQFLLDNHKDYLQPLRDRGIKILLGILGNHDEAGLSQLSDWGCKEFARELSLICDVYDLDGVNFDDEYSEAPNLQNPWFTKPSPAAASRLLYETKRCMPDKLVTVYYLGYISPYCPSVYGMTPNKFVDIAVEDYGKVTKPMIGMTNKQCAGMSVELNEMTGSQYATENYAKKVKEDGFGYYMWFSLNPKWYSKQVHLIQNVSTGLYGQTVLYPKYYYSKNDLNRYPL